jgi:hypothetical protein
MFNIYYLNLGSPDANERTMNLSDYLFVVYVKLFVIFEQTELNEPLIKRTRPSVYFPDSTESISIKFNIWEIRAGNFFLHHRVQTGSGAHPASYPMGTTDSLPGGKAVGT